MCTNNLLKISEKTKIVFLNLSRTMGVLCVMLAMFAGSAIWALDVPQGPVVLKVSGLIEAHNQGKVAVLDMKALQALPQKSFTTQTPWDPKPVTFSGPLLRDVLQLVKAKGQHIRAAHARVGDFTDAGLFQVHDGLAHERGGVFVHAAILMAARH